MEMGMTKVMGFTLYDGHCGNSRDGDSSHGSTEVAVTELTVDALFIHKLK